MELTLNDGSKPSMRFSPCALGSAAAVLSIAVGLAVLIGWQARIEVLKNPLPSAGSSFMTANAALCIFLLGVSLWCHSRPSPNRRLLAAGKLCGIFVTVFAGLTLAEYVFGADLGIDALFFRHRMSDWTLPPPVGRFALITAVCFVLLGLALILLRTRFSRTATACSYAVAFLAFTNLIGYLYGASALYTTGSPNHIALHTAVILLVISLGILLIEPGAGLQWMLSADYEVVLARRFLVVLFVLFPFVGWLLLQAENAEAIDHGLASALLIVFNIVVIAAITLYTFARLQTENQYRKAAEEKLRSRELQFTQLAEMMPQLAWIANPDGGVVWYNRRWYEYTGTTPEQVEGWGWQSVHDPKELPDVFRRWTISIETGAAFQMVFPLRGADGSYRRFLTNVMPIRGGDNKVVQWFGTCTDISGQQEVETGHTKAASS